MDILGFIKWQFRGSLTSMSFWGFVGLAMATIMLVLGQSVSWIMTLAGLGAVLVILDTTISWFRFSYSIYEMRQRDIRRESERN
jgi:hypothetical protein